MRANLCRWPVIGILTVASSSSAQQPAQPMPQAITPAAPRVFGSNTGLVLNFIKPDKTEDFEAIVAKLKEALQKSAKPERKLQAAGWRVFKAADPAAGGNALYVYIVDPAVKGADYSVSTILAEAFPQDAQALYKQYADAYASGQNFVSLSLISDLGK
jgi:hypothetical protein